MNKPRDSALIDPLPPEVMEAINAYGRYYAEHHKLGMSIRDDMKYIASVAIRFGTAAVPESGSIPVAWLSKDHHGRDIAISAAALAEQTDYVKEKWADAKPLYAAPQGGSVVETPALPGASAVAAPTPRTDSLIARQEQRRAIYFPLRLDETIALARQLERELAEAVRQRDKVDKQRKRFRLADRIQLKLVRVDLETRKIDLVPVDKE